ncbi:MAG: CoA pyrophosphatase [Anaerolineae bacterium]
MIRLDDVRRALALPAEVSERARFAMSPVPRGLPPNAPPREAGVLALLTPRADGRLHLLLTRRQESLRGHSGQISFPGGQRDPHDPDFTATALRETCEELGICEPIEVLGMLATVYIPPSNFNVYPSVGYLRQLSALRPNEAEVAEVLTLTLEELLDPSVKQEETRLISGYTVRVPYYHVGGHKVWGATAIMLFDLELRLRQALRLARG